MTDGLSRLKVLINSSTPIVVMETAEEMHAVGMVRTACAELNMAVFEWSIADGLVRSGSNALVPERLTRSAMSSLGRRQAPAGCNLRTQADGTAALPGAGTLDGSAITVFQGRTIS